MFGRNQDDRETYKEMGYLAYRTSFAKSAEDVADALSLYGEDRKAFIEGFNKAAWDD